MEPNELLELLEEELEEVQNIGSKRFSEEFLSGYQSAVNDLGIIIRKELESG